MKGGRRTGRLKSGGPESYSISARYVEHSDWACGLICSIFRAPKLSLSSGDKLLGGWVLSLLTYFGTLLP